MLVLVLRLEQNQKFDSKLLEEIARAQSAPARLQTRRRIFDLGEGFPADCFDEDQAQVLAEEIGKDRGARSDGGVLRAVRVADRNSNSTNLAKWIGLCAKLILRL